MIVAIAFGLLLIIGTPIGFSIGIAGLVGIVQMGGPQFLAMGPSRMFNSLDIFPFLAMPFFILAGEIMNHVGITQQLMRFAHVLVGHFRGGLAHANMVASVLFAGLTGAATADAAAFGKTLVPEMVRQGYRRDYACAVTAAGSIIGPTIPPSGIMVVYGSLMGVSIGGLFAAGILPGLLICAVCMAVIALGARRNGLPEPERRATFGELMGAFFRSIAALIMPLIILGGILGGVVTPTEAASVAVAYALALGVFVYRNITFKVLCRLLLRTAVVSGVIFVIIGFASTLGWWMSFNRVPQAIAEAMLAISENRYVLILLIIGLLMLIGTIMDVTAILIILAPVLLQIALQIGLEPIHAGIIFIIALNISLMTPPVGACLFVLSSVTGEKLERIAMKLWPFLVAEIAVLVLFAFWEDMALLIPRWLGFA
ncbi:tripartite ATP-independent transporter DctM subunit [Rhodobium orientis]|uniref:TRAP transporter large permease protein n=1 Tax=Rhodobium orientis TaxID=34017 RepID=A0A327JIY5_9HYPH|nr:TRAP transporter large permease [Rhodobium orientis]MBB4303845.1 tripartite ATP-independent transporter DctM subunit [Rhodobium orientis]MBK5947963.1 C4-dicarboxylate ABC transporter permease [Rhodobium orientis]RAI25324.1 C4-dicarboxylate ABC transporter permease [Rhodobium orientis]